MNLKFKNITILLIVFFSLSLPAIGQYTKIGVKGTTNLCGLWGPGKPDYFTKSWGYGAGLFFNFPIAENFYSVFELDYSHRVFNFTEPLYDIENSKLSVTEKNDFIEIPAMLKLQRGDEFTSVNMFFGWQASFLLKNRQEVTAIIGRHEVPYQVYYDFENGFYDYGFAAGAGFQVKAVTVDARYYMSMRNIHTGETAREMRYTTINIALGYQFNYVAPRVFRKNTAIKELKYRIKRRFK